MAGEAGYSPREWLAVDETAAAFLSRSLSTRPPILLPPPLHRAPLRPGNVVEIAGPSNSGKSQLLLMGFFKIHARGFNSFEIFETGGRKKWFISRIHAVSMAEQESGFSCEKDSEVLSVHTSEWVHPSLNTKEKFYIKDDGVGLIQ